ncbi:hypothetical protein D1007_42352 [Hordeum vulgare]|nr:hypothetical protein D1007_42352 [Hordeum vulgare]
MCRPAHEEVCVGADYEVPPAKNGPFGQLMTNQALRRQRSTNLIFLSDMASTTCFVIVSKNDIPIYDAEVGSAPKKEDQAYQHQFILHAALDVVQDLAWATSAMFLKSVDRFNDLVVSVYVTAGHIL